MKGTGDGSIILMHDRKHRGKQTVMEATRAIVPALRAKGFTFVTISELLATPRTGNGALKSGSAIKPVEQSTVAAQQTPEPAEQSVATQQSAERVTESTVATQQSPEPVEQATVAAIQPSEPEANSTIPAQTIVPVLARQPESDIAASDTPANLPRPKLAAPAPVTIPRTNMATTGTVVNTARGTLTQ